MYVSCHPGIYDSQSLICQYVHTQTHVHTHTYVHTHVHTHVHDKHLKSIRRCKRCGPPRLSDPTILIIGLLQNGESEIGKAGDTRVFVNETIILHHGSKTPFASSWIHLVIKKAGPWRTINGDGALGKCFLEINFRQEKVMRVAKLDGQHRIENGVVFSIEKDDQTFCQKRNTSHVTDKLVQLCTKKGAKLERGAIIPFLDGRGKSGGR